MYSLIEGLARGSNSQLREKHGHFYALYCTPLTKYLCRKFEYGQDSSAAIVHAFLEKNFWTADPSDSLVAKYLRKLGMTYLSQIDGALNTTGISPIVADYLAKHGAAKLAGQKAPKTKPPDLFDAELLQLGTENFWEVREMSDARSFRGYLLRALYHFAVDQQRKDLRKQHVDPAAITANATPEPDERDELVMVLDQFVTIFRRAIEKCRNSPRNTRVHWDIFDAYLVRPSVTGEAQPTMSEIAIRFREAIMNSASKERRVDDWTDEQVEKAARNRLDAIRRTLWHEVDRLIDAELPPELKPDLQEIISSRGRNEFLRHYFKLNANESEDAVHCDVTFASYLSSFLGDSEENDAPTQSDDELRREWVRIVSQPIYVLLSKIGVPEARQFKDCIEYEGHPLFNLEQCWRHPSPPEHLLVWIKDAAKADADRPVDRQSLARPIRMALYAAAIAAGHVKLNTWISSKPRHEFKRPLEKVLSFGWMDDGSRQMIADCLKIGTTP